MELLDMPPEMVQRVVGCYVSKFGVVQAWKTRSICRTWREYVEYEVLARQPVRAFTRQGSLSGREILRHNMATFVAYRIKNPKGLNTFLPNFMNRMITALTQVAGDSNDATQNEYAKLLSHVFANTYEHAYHLIIVNPTKPINANKAAGFAEGMSANLIAAAAAIGSLDAIRHFVAQDSKALWDKSVAFGYPLAAAALAGRDDMVMILYKHLLAVRKAGADKSTYKCLTPAIDAAIRGCQYKVANFLLRAIINYSKPLISAAYAKLLIASVRTGNVKFVSLILDCGVLPTQHTLASAFTLAVKDNHEEIATYFCTGGHIRINKFMDDYGVQSPLKTAVQRGRLELTKALLDMGAYPDGPSNIQEHHWYLHCPLEVAVKKRNVKIVQLLLECGAIPHLVKSYEDIPPPPSAIRVLIDNAKRHNTKPVKFRIRKILKDVSELMVYDPSLPSSNSRGQGTTNLVHFR
ncbi:ankyrin repeat-containing domain protein [Lophiotrema nucula]|uniref:Ankyrin repeat-containing domain protein n=1 Tax=Lophiotrema nucula TaxID=690887 RepID=A0A6A5ZGJ9_9PLEO|nr:ankyrin repeat-containing domain protein [Lophiotrema nucula]